MKILNKISRLFKLDAASRAEKEAARIAKGREMIDKMTKPIQLAHSSESEDIELFGNSNHLSESTYYYRTTRFL